MGARDTSFPKKENNTMKTIYPANYVQALLEAIRERWMAIDDREIWEAVHRDCVADLCQQNCSARSYLAAALLEREAFEWLGDSSGTEHLSRIVGPENWVNEEMQQKPGEYWTDLSECPEEPSVTILPGQVTVHYFRVTYPGTEQIESVYDRCSPGTYSFERKQTVVGRKVIRT